jgi:hypothetical protein
MARFGKAQCAIGSVCNSAQRLNFGNVFKYCVRGPLINYYIKASIKYHAMGPLTSRQCIYLFTYTQFIGLSTYRRALTFSHSHTSALTYSLTNSTCFYSHTASALTYSQCKTCKCLKCSLLVILWCNPQADSKH